MPEEWKTRLVTEIDEHQIEFESACGCTKVSVVRAVYFVQRFGPGATIEEAERRMRCRTCKRRPAFTMTLQWAITGGRDRRPERPPLPDWIGDHLSERCP